MIDMGSTVFVFVLSFVKVLAEELQGEQLGLVLPCKNVISLSPHVSFLLLLYSTCIILFACLAHFEERWSKLVQVV
jgi:hypothetical protein